MVFSLAHPFGTPTILSSYQFGNTDDGAPNGGEQRVLFALRDADVELYAGAGTCSGTGGTNGWLCQVRQSDE
jgi:hypothetical protein